jgi:hypothetical protein
MAIGGALLGVRVADVLDPTAAPAGVKGVSTITADRAKGDAPAGSGLRDRHVDFPNQEEALERGNRL